MRSFVKSLVLCAVLLVPARAALAQETLQGNNIQLFNPTPGGHGFFSREYAEVGTHLEPYVALWFNYAKSPLVRYRLDPSTNRLVLDRTIVAHQLSGDLVGAIALWDMLELGLGVPFVLYQSGQGLPATPSAPAQSLANIAFGDLRLQPKLAFINSEHFNLAIAVMVTLPTGSQENFIGEQTVTGVPRAITNFRFVDRRLNMGFDLGVRLRGPAQLANITFGHELAWGAHLSYEFVKRKFTGGVEVYGGMGFPKRRPDGSVGVSLDESPIDMLAGFKYRVGWFVISAGAGTGITTGYGSPQVRVLAGLAFHPLREPEPASLEAASLPMREPEPAPPPPPPPPPVV